MKTTVDISPALLEKAKKIMASENVTLKTLLEDGLLLAIERRQKSKKVFKLKDASVSGRGLSREFSDASWSDIREALYPTEVDDE